MRAYRFILQPLRRISADSLYRNSFFLMASTGVLSLFGFIFWAICARLFDAAAVGLAASLISATALLTNLSFLGFTNTLIRYIPTAKNKSAYAGTAVTTTSLAALVFSGIFLLGIQRFAPDIANAAHGPFLWPLVMAYVVLTTISALCDSLFIAERASQNVLIKNTLFSSIKIALLFAFISQGFIGIFIATAIGVAIATGVSIYLAYKRGIALYPQLNKKVLKQTRRFTTGNYLGNIFGAMPATLLPILVATKLGAAAAAYFYMPMMIATLLNIIPSAASQSLMAEASHNITAAMHHAKKALMGIFYILIPAVIATILLGQFILAFFGNEYAHEGGTVLHLLAIASLFGAVNYVGDTLLVIRKQVKGFIAMNIINAAAVITGVVWGMHNWGIVGVGTGWLVGQIITMCIYLGYYGRTEFNAHRTSVTAKS